MHVRLISDLENPPDVPLVTLRKIGTTADPKLPTYNPLERCGRGHAPLRYLNGGGCVHCARKPSEWGKQQQVQIPEGAEAGTLVEAMGWQLVQLDPIVRHGTQRLIVKFPIGASMAHLKAACAALGWVIVH